MGRNAVARSGHGLIARGYTLVEMLTATVLTLIMMAAVASVFATVGASVSAARSTLEMTDAQRGAAAVLKADLEGVTATMAPPRRPEDGEGYFEYIEGPIGPAPAAAPSFVDNDNGGTVDSTVGDSDDILTFTTRRQTDILGRSHGDVFVGRWWNAVAGAVQTIESRDAEVAWFVRGRTLYRRVLLVRPDIDVSGADYRGFYNNNDLSVRLDRDAAGALSLRTNSLGDLTNRENRFAHSFRDPSDASNDDLHPNASSQPIGFPYSASRWGQLGLPTLGETSYYDSSTPNNSWLAGAMSPTALAPTAATTIDLWLNPHPWGTTDLQTGNLSAYLGARFGEDVILNNVIGFDVKAWDPGAPVLRAVNDNGTPTDLTDDTLVSPVAAVLPGDPGYALALAHLSDYLPVAYGAYVDLGYYTSNPTYSVFAGTGGAAGLVRVYDTWSLFYEYNSLNENGNTSVDEGTNGFDDNGDGVVDDPGEMEAPPPYAAPLRGIQVKIRVFDRDSRQIREVTVVQDFLGK